MSRAGLIQRLLDWTEAPNLWIAARRVGEYAALRMWGITIGCFSVETNLRTARWMGRLWWLLFKRHRDRAMDNLRPALGDRYSNEELREIAKRSLEHFAQVYLVELAMTPRLITKWSWARHVELDQLDEPISLLLRNTGVIMLTPHFGNYELLGFTICRLGIPLTAIMRPLDNPLINRYLCRTREESGLTLLYKKGVTAVAPAVLDRGEALCFIADQDAGRRGMFVDFFGRQASTYKSIGLLAMQKRVPIVVGYAARVRAGFQYRLAAERVIHPDEWEEQDDPLRWITQTFSHAMESAIRRWPEQYLWMHRRWKHRPKGEKPAPATSR